MKAVTLHWPERITPGPGKTIAGQCNDLFLSRGVTRASLLWFEANVKAVTEAYLL